MDPKTQILYAKLTQKDRGKVDAKIHELFTKQQDQPENEIYPNTHRQEDHC